VELGLFTAAGLLALRNSPVRSHAGRLGVSAGLVASVALIAISATLRTDAGRALTFIWTTVLLLLTVLVLIRQILLMPTVTLQSIYGAVSAYLMIGLMFAAIYAASYYLNGRAFFAGNESGTAATFQYFSFTTLTTLGYGDFTAAGPGGQAIAMIEAMTGQIFLATLVARLVAAFRPASQNSQQTGTDDHH
jgi:voltage-gated potassium channel Kch